MRHIEQRPDLLKDYNEFLAAEMSDIYALARGEYSKPTLLASFILFINWVLPGLPENFLQVTGLEKIILPMDPESVRTCALSLGVELEPPTDLESTTETWERLLNRVQQSKTTGTYFTPIKIAELMASLLILGEGRRIVDPACGTGILLVPYLHRFPPEKRVQELKNVCGWDINPLNVVIARVNLLLEVLESRNAKYIKDLNDIAQIWALLKENITTRDALQLKSLPHGFDAAIINPPYLRIEMLKNQKEALGEFDLIHRRLDSYLLFLELCLHLINEAGEVVAIVPDKVLTESNGKLLRQKILDENLLRKLIDCRNEEIFNANVNPVILHLSGKYAKEAVETYSLGKQDGSYRLRRQDSVPVSLFQTLPSARIDPQLTTERVRILEKIFTKSFPLKEIAYVSYGAQPGIKGNFVFESVTQPSDNKQMKWLLRGRDVKKYRIEPPSYVINYVPEKLHRPAFPQLFLSPRVVVQKVTGKQGLIAGIVPTGAEYYTDDSIINIITLDNLASVPAAFRKNRGLKFVAGNNERIPVGKQWWQEVTKAYARGAVIREDLSAFYKQFSPIVLCATINSQVIAFFFKLLLAGGLNVFPEHVRWLPVTPDIITCAPNITTQLADIDHFDEELLNASVFQAYGLNAGEIGTIKRFLAN